MGVNLSIAELRKIADFIIEDHQSYRDAEYTLVNRDHALATVLRELHLTTLANELEKEVKIVRGD